MSETLTFTLIGGSGGDNNGGQGAKVTTKLSIASGTILYLVVGSAGSGGFGSASANGGYNGGGNGGGTATGAGGGGATHVALQTGRLVDIGEANKSDVLIVAAGGGGGGQANSGAGAGGDAGINGGTGGTGGNGNSGAGGGGGGTSSSGGDGGDDNSGGGFGGGDGGGFGFGGNGNIMSAGGGSGYYGGGGGGDQYASGGGGYSFVTQGYGVNDNDTEYQNVSEGPSIKIVDSSGLETVFSYTGGIQTYVVPSYASEPAPDVGASPDLPAEPAEKDNFRYNIIPSQKNSYGLRLLYNNLTYSLTNQPKGVGIANTSLGKRATRRR